MIKKLDRFNIKSYLTDRRISFVEKGKNVMKEHVGIKCVRCDDGGTHLNLKVDGTHALCFRCRVHVWGVKNVLELIEGRRLKQIDILKIVNKYKDIDNRVEQDKGNDGIKNTVAKVSDVYKFFYGNCGELKKQSVYGRYLLKRGVDIEFAKWFEIREGREGDWQWYVMIPVKNERGELISYVGRLVCNSKYGLRYKNASKEVSRYRGLFGLWECKELGLMDKGYVVVAEGVFDVLKLLQYKIPAVGLMTKTITDFQLVQLVKTFKKGSVVLVGLDADASEEECYMLKNRLLTWYKDVLVLGFGGRGGDIVFNSDKKDYGDMSEIELVKLKKFIEKTI